jgi:4-amino-4-deoxy-L-arabinose transferase-like glycosyltransferase
LLALLLSLTVLAVWRTWVGAHLPLSVDEAYYHAWSLTPDWGYWTKPPLIAWAMGAVDSVCGPSAGCLRSVGVGGFSATALVIYALARRMQQTPAAASAAAIGFATLPLASFYGVAASTDALLLLCWTCAMYSLWLALQGHTWGWLGLGLSAGLGLLAKYSMVVLGPSVALVLLHRPWRHHWRQPGPYVAAALALLVFAPNLWWNLTHGMPTLQHTADISRGQAYSLNPQVMVGFLAEQALVGNVVLFGTFVAWLVRKRWRDSDAGWFVLMLSAPMMGVMAMQALLSRANANWAAPAHVAIAMAAVAMLWQKRSKAWLGAALAFNVLFAVLLYHGQTLIREPLGLAASWRTDPYWALRNWPGLQDQVRSALSQRQPLPQGWRVASDDRAVLAQLQWGLQLPAGHAMGWMAQGVPMNHFDQRFALQTRSGPVLLITQASADLVKQQFPKAQPGPALRADLIESEALIFSSWWLE